MVRAALLTFLLTLSAPGRVYIATVPSVLQAGGNVRITCTVPKHPDNRWLKIGIDNYRTSIVQLDGDSAAVTHVMVVQQVPCDTPTAICAVQDNLGKVYSDVRDLGLAGCAAPPDDISR